MASRDHPEEKDIPIEPEMRDGESCMPGKSNQLIIFGRDRPASIDTGYGSEPETGTIHIIIGRKSRDPSFKDDKSFIYTTMKTDVDKNLGLDGMKGHDAKVGPAIIFKSDNVRIVHRQNGDVRISSEDGKNFIVLNPTSCEIRIGAAWLKIEDGVINVEAGKVNVGEKAVDAMVKGTTFQTYFMAHTHMSPTGPCSFPQEPWTEALLSKKGFVE